MLSFYFDLSTSHISYMTRTSKYGKERNMLPYFTYDLTMSIIGNWAMVKKPDHSIGANWKHTYHSEDSEDQPSRKELGYPKAVWVKLERKLSLFNKQQGLGFRKDGPVSKMAQLCMGQVSLGFSRLQTAPWDLHLAKSLCSDRDRGLTSHNKIIEKDLWILRNIRQRVHIKILPGRT